MSLDPDLWELTYADDELQWDGSSLRRIAEQYQTPLYVVNETRLKKNIARFRAKAEEYIPHSEIYYSCKTSGIHELTTHFVKSGIGAEVVTGHEMEVMLRLGVPPEKIIFGGTNKQRNELRFAVDSNVKLIIIDLMEELQSLKEIVDSDRQQVDIALRISFHIQPRHTFRINTTSSSINHLGFNPFSDEFQAALHIIRNDEQLRLIGLHSHIGTGLRDIKSFSANVEQLISLYAELKKTGLPLAYIDIGGGLGVTTVKEFSPIGFLKYALWGRMPSQPGIDHHLVENYFQAIADAVDKSSNKYDVQPPKIILEPGRILSSDAVLLLLKVGAIRKRNKKSQFAIVDGGAMSVGLSFLAEYHEVFHVTKKSESKVCYTIIGRVPTPLDLIYKNKMLPKLSPGDYLAVMDAGAYLIPTATSFASLRPGIVCIDDGTTHLMRRHEIVDDLFMRSIGHA